MASALPDVFGSSWNLNSCELEFAIVWFVKFVRNLIVRPKLFVQSFGHMPWPARTHRAYNAFVGR